MKKFLIFLLFTIIISGCIGVAGFLFYYNHMNGTTTNASDQYLLIENEMTMEDAAGLLLEKELVRSTEAVMNYSKYYKLQGNIKQGNYIIKANLPLKDLFLKLQQGNSDFAIVTIPEGYSLYKIGELLEKNNLLKKEELLPTARAEFDKTNMLSDNPSAFYSLEGYLFPDTYYIPYNSSKEEIINKLFGNFKKVFSEKSIQRAKELNLSVNDVITIASLIEKEAANDEERKKISGVIYNRIKQGMVLQIDASVIYANTKGEKNINPLTKTDLAIDSKYNLYKSKGLPPGPICSPGKASIEAALFPEEHDYLYYVLGPNGHVFSKTYPEHLANVKKYIK